MPDSGSSMFLGRRRPAAYSVGSLALVGLVIPTLVWLSCKLPEDFIIPGLPLWHSGDMSDVPTAVWDAGILIPDSMTAVLFPIDDPAVECAEDIVAIMTSCDCTTAEPWDYWDNTGRRRVAIRIQMLEQSEPKPRAAAVPLAVVLSIATRSGEVILRSVRVLLSDIAHETA